MSVLWKHRLRTSGTVTVLTRCFAVGSDGLLSPQPAELPDEERDAVVRVLEAVPGNYARVMVQEPAETASGASVPDPAAPVRPAPRPAPKGRPGAAPRP